MKHFSKLLVLALFAGICTMASAQQTFKFGHINSSELMMLMPERDSAIAKVDAYGKELQDQIESMQVDLNNKINVYQSKQATWGAAILEAKQQEIQDMSVRIDEFQKTAQGSFQQMQQTVLRPVIEKATNAIKKVGKDNGFTYIFDISVGAVPYFNADQSEDILPLVRTELKIPTDKVLPVGTR